MKGTLLSKLDIFNMNSTQPSTQAFPSRLLNLGFGAKCHDVTE